MSLPVETVSLTSCPGQDPLRGEPQPGGDKTHSLPITNKETPSPAAQRREGLGTHQGGQEGRKLVGLRHLMASCPSWTRLAERLACSPHPSIPPQSPPPASPTRPFTTRFSSSSGPEAEVLEAFPHSGLALGAFLASETQVFQEPAFPMRLSSMKAGGGGRGGDRERDGGWGG